MLEIYHKIKNKKYQTVWTVPKFNRKKRDKNRYP